MSYATEAPDATLPPFPKRQRDLNHVVCQSRKNHHPVVTRRGFDFYMNFYNHV